MNIARIDEAGLVVNVEVADQAWVDENQGVDGFTFVESTDDNQAWIGATYDASTGLFSSMPVPDALVINLTDTVEASQ